MLSQTTLSWIYLPLLPILGLQLKSWLLPLNTSAKQVGELHASQWSSLSLLPLFYWQYVATCCLGLLWHPLRSCLDLYTDIPSSIFHGRCSLFVNQTQIVLGWYDIHFSGLRLIIYYYMDCYSFSLRHRKSHDFCLVSQTLRLIKLQNPLSRIRLAGTFEMRYDNLFVTWIWRDYNFKSIAVRIFQYAYIALKDWTPLARLMC